MLAIFLGDGRGGFHPASTTPLGKGHARAPRAVDLNGDGAPDVVLSRDSGRLTVLLGDGTGGFAHHADVRIPAGAAAILAGDFNLDGLADLAAVDEDGDSITILTSRD